MPKQSSVVIEIEFEIDYVKPWKARLTSHSQARWMTSQKMSSIFMIAHRNDSFYMKSACYPDMDGYIAWILGDSPDHDKRSQWHDYDSTGEAMEAVAAFRSITAKLNAGTIGQRDKVFEP